MARELYLLLQCHYHRYLFTYVSLDKLLRLLSYYVPRLRTISWVLILLEQAEIEAL